MMVVLEIVGAVVGGFIRGPRCGQASRRSLARMTEHYEEHLPALQAIPEAEAGSS